MPVINVATFIYIADGNFAMVPPASVKEVTEKLSCNTWHLWQVNIYA